MKKKPEWKRKLEQLTDKASSASSKAFNGLSKAVSHQATQLDNEYNISKHSRELADSTKSAFSTLDEKLELRQKTEAASRGVKTATSRLSQTVKESGLDEFFSDAKNKVRESVATPVSGYIKESGLRDKFGKASELVEEAYGQARSLVKPYYAPDTPEELLRTTKQELIYINACILQISCDEAEQLANKLGAAIVSKVAGAATVGTLLTMVSAFGSAGTGTAIASLSGAAATNATLAWVGGLLGGGMATGAALTGGVALVVGVGVYKMVSSEARQIEQLSEPERRIVESTGFLIAAINDILKDPEKIIQIDEAQTLLDNTFRPLYQSLLENADDICINLDKKHQILFKQHALVDFEHYVIHGFEYFVNQTINTKRHYPEFVIAGVIYALLTRSAIDDSHESQLALQAIRRMKADWNDASEAELSDFLSEYDSAQLKGIANNVKGIYHEILFVDQYNDQHDDSYAVLFEDTNHAGADIQIRNTGSDEVIEEFQLKASCDISYVNKHFEKYPDINVLATDEVAMKIDNCEGSGISNIEITNSMNSTLDSVADNTILDRATESAAMASLVSAGKAAFDVLNGKQDVARAGGVVLKTASIASVSTALVAYLFS